MCRKLPRQRVMNLKEYLDFRNVLVEAGPDAIDQNPHGGLRNPGKGFREQRLHPVEDIPSVSPAVLDKPVLVYLVKGPGVPLRYPWVSGKPVLLRLVDFMYRPASVGGDCLRAPSVVRRVSEDLSELPSVLEGQAVVAVARVGFY